MVSDDAFDGLVTAALLGTDRRPVDVAGLPGDLGRLAATIPAQDAPGRLLAAAALVSTARRASSGARSLTLDAPSQAGPETAMWASPAAQVRLGQLLGRADPAGAALLAEWLDVAARRGVVVAPRYLLQLLDLALRHADHVASVRGVLGERGRWLAAFRPDWARAAGLEHATAAHPDPARPTASQRAEAVAVAVSEDDLEAGLTDPSVDVRVAAVGRAASLPTSAFATQVADRATASLSVERRRMRRTLVVNLPPAAEPLRTPDPFPKAPHGIGAASWHLYQLLAAAPLSTWERAFDLTPAQIVALPIESDINPAVHTAWQLAAQRQRDPSWARALMDTIAVQSRDLLLDILEPAERVDLLVAWTRAAASPIEMRRSLEIAFRAIPGPWPSTLADVVLANLGSSTTDRPLVEWATFHLGQLLRPDELTETAVRATARRHPDHDPANLALRDLADHLLTRRQMLEELR